MMPRVRVVVDDQYTRHPRSLPVAGIMAARPAAKIQQTLPATGASPSGQGDPR